MVTLPNTRQSYKTRYSSFERLVAGLLVLIPIVVFWYVWAHYAVNVPKWDDHALKTFLSNLEKEPSFSGDMYLFFKQHNEHRIVYDRLVTWLDFHLFGKFNYLHLMVVGNLSLLGLLVIFWLALSEASTPPSTLLKRRSFLSLANGLLYLPPVAYLLLNLSQWENMFWGMAALQNFTVVFWIFWAIYLLAFTQKIGAALVVAVAATLTSGNGLLVWPVGFAMLFLQAVFQNRASRTNLIRWSGVAIVAILLYFWGYEKPVGNPPTKGSFLDLIGGWFAFMGSAAEAFPIQSVVRNCVLLGGLSLVIVLGICLYILKKWLAHKILSPFDYFFLGSAAFLVGTGAVVAWTRTGFGINTLITSRYKLYSLLLITLLYVYIVGQTRALRQKLVVGIGLIVSIALMGGSYRAYQDDAIWWRQYLLTQQFNWTYTQNKPVSKIDVQTIYLIDNSPAFYDSQLSALYKAATGTSMPLGIQKKNAAFTLNDTTAITPAAPDAGTYILLKSSKRLYLFQTTPIVNHSWRTSIGLSNLFQKGFSTTFPESGIEPETYQIERLLVQPDGIIKRYPTGQAITAVANSPTQPTIQTNW